MIRNRPKPAPPKPTPKPTTAPKPAQAQPPARALPPDAHLGDIPPKLLGAFFEVLEADYEDNALMTSFIQYVEQKIDELDDVPTPPEPEPEPEPEG